MVIELGDNKDLYNKLNSNEFLQKIVDWSRVYYNNNDITLFDVSRNGVKKSAIYMSDKMESVPLLYVDGTYLVISVSNSKDIFELEYSDSGEVDLLEYLKKENE